jgi:hypothetical protein
LRFGRRRHCDKGKEDDHQEAGRLYSHVDRNPRMNERVRGFRKGSIIAVKSVADKRRKYL